MTAIQTFKQARAKFETPEKAQFIDSFWAAMIKGRHRRKFPDCKAAFLVGSGGDIPKLRQLGFQDPNMLAIERNKSLLRGALRYHKSQRIKRYLGDFSEAMHTLDSPLDYIAIDSCGMLAAPLFDMAESVMLSNALKPGTRVGFNFLKGRDAIVKEARNHWPDLGPNEIRRKILTNGLNYMADTLEIPYSFDNIGNGEYKNDKGVVYLWNIYQIENR